MHRLAAGEGRPALLAVPETGPLETPRPLAVMLHGAGGTAGQGLDLLRPFAESHAVAVLAPQSHGATWDVIEGGYGPDVAQLDRLLARVFATYAVDPERIAVGGFSDGASYALSLGLANGSLFRRVIALSPGFLAPAALDGLPAIYVSYGTADRVLPIDRCSRALVPRLERAGYHVRYREFAGGHAIPPEIAQEAVAWFLG